METPIPQKNKKGKAGIASLLYLSCTSASSSTGGANLNTIKICFHLKVQSRNSLFSTIHGLVIIQAHNAANRPVDNPDPRQTNHGNTKSRSAQSHTGKEIRIVMGKEQQQERNESDDIPDQIPPESADLPGKMTFKNCPAHRRTFYIVNHQGNDCQQACAKNRHNI